VETCYNLPCSPNSVQSKVHDTGLAILVTTAQSATEVNILVQFTGEGSVLVQEILLLYCGVFVCYFSVHFCKHLKKKSNQPHLPEQGI